MVLTLALQAKAPVMEWPVDEHDGMACRGANLMIHQMYNLTFKG